MRSLIDGDDELFSQLMPFGDSLLELIAVFWAGSPEFSLEGSARADLRQAHRRAERDGATFEVIGPEQVMAMKIRHLPFAFLQELP